MAGIGTLTDLLLFYTLERVLFDRIVISLGKNPLQVKQAIALWLVLEESGYRDLIRTINSLENNAIEAFFDQAIQFLNCIKPTSISQPRFEPNDTPLFMSVGFFCNNHDFMYKRFEHIMETVCDKIFGESKSIEVNDSDVRPVVKDSGEGGSSEEQRQSNLNPVATEFYPGHTPEDARTLFLTFSNGHPLTPEEIVNFFTSRWGEVVQDVFIEKTRGRAQNPRFGRIVFTQPLAIPKVLSGQTKAKFLVNGKHLWARIYVPRH